MVRARMYNVGQRSGNALERVPQVLLVDAQNPQARLMQQARYPRDIIGDVMILLNDGALAPDRRPADLPESSLNVWDRDAGSRLAMSRGLLEWSVDGGMVDAMGRGMEGVFRLFGRAFRRRTNSEVRNEERQDDDEAGY